MTVDWMVRGACRNADPELFFPAGRRGQWTSRQLRAARRICSGCPVNTECLRYALVNPHLAAQGYWAGTVPVERRRLRQQLAGSGR